MMSPFNARSLLVVTLLSLSWGSWAEAQFGGTDWFSELMNQALPRMTPTNAPVGSQGYPGAPSGIPTSSSSSNFPTSPLPSSGFGPSAVPGQITGRPRDWTLGVALENLDVGAIVRQVANGSAAQRSGIEQGDLIVAIGGSQVGLVNGRLNDVGDQIRRSADVNGRVIALVLDGRTSRLQNIPLDLESASRSIVGTAVLLRDRVNLPMGSILQVRLENVSQPHWEINGGQTDLQIYGPGPYPFELHYDPRDINPSFQYRINATITNAARQVMYALRQPILVPATAIPANIRLDMESLRDLQTGGGGGVVQASYPADPQAMNRVFQELLGRLPTPKEQVAWSSYLAQGNSLDDLKAKILGSANFYDRVQNNPTLFVQAMIRILKGQPATPGEVAAWSQRLQQYQGQREEVVREFIEQNR